MPCNILKFQIQHLEVSQDELSSENERIWTNSQKNQPNRLISPNYRLFTVLAAIIFTQNECLS